MTQNAPKAANFLHYGSEQGHELSQIAFGLMKLTGDGGLEMCGAATEEIVDAIER